MKLSINQTFGFRYNKKFIEKLFRSIAGALPKFSSNEVSVALVGDRTIRRLNKKYRKIDRATDVLSFADYDRPIRIRSGDYLGEIIIAYPYARRQAKRHGHGLGRELAILLTHGFLHLAGYDHLNKKSEQKMKRLEKTIIAKFDRAK